MFSQVVAVDNDSWAPSLRSLPSDMRDAAEEDDNLEHDIGAPACQYEELAGTSTNIGDASSSSCKRRKTAMKKGIALSRMNELREFTFAVKPPPVVTIKETVELISSIADIYDNPDLYYFSLSYIKDKNNREVFMSIPHDKRVWWLKNSFEKEGK
ncbi:hypothetical protein KSP40_PGU016582 [Platanthera guangdongensis]|uniref:Uncharacterized protein n=1 Tax=Platanthera guangdongensis TaxID=2320717 RepID=A0ABR2MKU3_9ASPA